MKLALIWAMAQNRTIGLNNDMPWHLPNDLRYFKATTLGKPVIMGRKTFESIGRPLPGRVNIVITRSEEWNHDGVLVVNSVDQAITAAEDLAFDQNIDEVIVMGGAEIYRQTLNKAHKLYITEIHAEIEGDTYFPPFDLSLWRETARENHAACDKNPHDYSFVVFEK